MDLRSGDNVEPGNKETIGPERASAEAQLNSNSRTRVHPRMRHGSMRLDSVSPTPEEHDD
eukprot:5867821-Pleurochrysis_carterae.AAC.2